MISVVCGVAVVVVHVAVVLLAFLLSLFRTSLQTYCNNTVSRGAISFD